MVGLDFFQTAELPAPVVTSEQTSALGRDLFGLGCRPIAWAVNRTRHYAVDAAAAIERLLCRRIGRSPIDGLVI